MVQGWIVIGTPTNSTNAGGREASGIKSNDSSHRTSVTLGASRRIRYLALVLRAAMLKKFPKLMLQVPLGGRPALVM